MTDDPAFPSSPIALKMLERADEIDLEYAPEYEVTAVAPHHDKPLRVRTYTFAVEDLDSYFMGYQHSPEVVIDVRPAE